MDLFPTRTFFQRDLSNFTAALLTERGIGFTLEFEYLSEIDNEPYCGFLTLDKLVRIELYEDSANLVTFFDGNEEAICLECYKGHTPEDVAEDFKAALLTVLKSFGVRSGKEVVAELDDRGIQSRWIRLFRR